MHVTINGERRELPAPATASDLLGQLGLAARKIAVERHLEIVPRPAYGATLVGDGDRLEIVHFIGGGDAQAEDDGFVVAGRRFRPPLIVGPGKNNAFAEPT